MSFTEKLSLENKPKLPTVWLVDNQQRVGAFNGDKGVAEKIRLDGEYEIHPFQDFNDVDCGRYKGKIPDIVVGDVIYCRNKDVFCVSSFCNDTFAAHCVTPQKIEAGKKEWETQFSGLHEPKIAVLLGGECHGFDFTPEKARKMAKEVAAKAKELGGSLIVTTSSRTGKEATEAFMDEIHKEYDVPAYLHDWRLDAAKDNPYFGILGLADTIIVGGDSWSMCCEANMSRKPVYIYAPEGTRECDAKLHQQLYDLNVAKPFSEFLEKGIEKWDYEPLDTAGDIAKDALERWHEKEQKKSTRTP